MRFLCDEMLARLARLLRAAGYDTYLAQGGERAGRKLQRVRDEARVLLTRDRRLAAEAAPASVLLVADRALDQARSLTAVLPIDWELAPFTRCVMDNAELRAASPEEIARMPPQARSGPGPLRACPACGRLYWPGSHVKRLSLRLHDLAQINCEA